MKEKHIGLIALAVVLIGLLAACETRPAPTQAISVSPLPEAPVRTVEPVQTAIPTQTPAMPETTLPNGNQTPVAEPLLDDAALAIAVPDFLTPEQQDLYRRAHSLYEHLLGTSIEYEETLGLDIFPPKEYETVEIGDVTYLVSQGRYAKWADFHAVIQSVFTDAFWMAQNDTGNGYPLHIEHDGRHCFLDTSMGMGYYYAEDIPDEFRLESKSDTEITFTLIGHYAILGGIEGETEEQREARLLRGYDYTLEFPIKMVLTDNGWRFDEFYSALVDEGEQG